MKSNKQNTHHNRHCNDRHMMCFQQAIFVHYNPRISRLSLDKMAAISQMIFADAFCELKVMYIDKHVTEVCS